MRTPFKIALGVLALAVALPTAYAQMPGPETAAPQRRWAPAERGQMRGGWGPGREMRGPRMRGRGGPAEMLLRLVNNPMMRQRVGITAEQAAKIRQQASDFLKQQIRSRASLQAQRIDLQNLMAADNPDRAAIDKTLEQISSVQLAQSKANVDFHLAMRNALTPEQQQKLMQMRQEFMRRGPGRGNRMGPRGPQGMMNRPGSAPPQSQNPPAEN
ncbi:MAG: periplasmic heavy metal sensor [Acidobacteriota bacterium]|nr:periplasmic heavy metal sensor [Acidobacteriota bacterium]